MNHFKLAKLPVALCLAAVVVLGGCHKKAAAPPPPPPPPVTAAPAPIANITAAPSTINVGQSSTLSWTTTNASSVSISGVGAVASSGSRAVYPASSTTYSLTAMGAGGNAEASARVTVNPPPPPPPAAQAQSLSDEQLFEQSMHDVYFDYDKFDLRPQDSSVVEQDAAFLVSHPGMRLVIQGHCDERGSEEYNLALGQSRGESLKKALVVDGVLASSIRVISFGKEKPFCTESNEQCWQQNRRDHLALDR